MRLHYLLLAVLLLTACETEEIPYKEIDVDTAWVVKKEGESQTVYEDVVYTTYFKTISAIEIPTGKLLWSLVTDRRIRTAQPVIDENYVYYIAFSNDPEKSEDALDCIILDKKTGSTVRKIYLFTETKYGEYKPRRGQFVQHNGLLIWPAGNGNVYRLNPVTEEIEILYTALPGGNFKPDEFSDGDMDIMSDMVIIGGILYFAYDDWETDGDHPKLCALNLLTKEVLFCNELAILDNPVGVGGIQLYKEHLLIGNINYLLLVSPDTGEIVKEIHLEAEIIREGNGIVSWGYYYLQGDIIYGGLDTMHYHAMAYSLKEEKFLWITDMNDSKFGSVLYTPVVHEGILYQPLQGSLAVLDARTGKILGYDYDIPTGPLACGFPAVYGDLMLFGGVNSRYYAVKMNYHKKR